MILIPRIDFKIDGLFYAYNVSGRITGSTWAGGFVSMGYLFGDVTFRNCVSTCSLFSNTSGGFFGHAYLVGNITIDNSYFKGTAYVKDGGNIGYICSQGPNTGKEDNQPVTRDTIDVTFENIKDSSLYNLAADISVTDKASFSVTLDRGWSFKDIIAYSKASGRNEVMENISNVTTLFHAGDHVYIDALKNTVKAQISLYVAPNNVEGKGGYLTDYVDETVQVKNGKITSESIYYSNITVNKDKKLGYYENNTVFNVNHNGWGPSYGAAYIEIQEYDKNDTLIRISRISLPSYVAD